MNQPKRDTYIYIKDEKKKQKLKGIRESSCRLCHGNWGIFTR